jgi:hypothetical protein
MTEQQQHLANLLQQRADLDKAIAAFIKVGKELNVI